LGRSQDDAAQPHHLEAAGQLAKTGVHAGHGERHVAEGSALAMQIHAPDACSSEGSRARSGDGIAQIRFGNRGRSKIAGEFFLVHATAVSHLVMPVTSLE